MIISAYNTCKSAAEDGRTIAGQLVREMHKEGDKRKYNLQKAFFYRYARIYNKGA